MNEQERQATIDRLFQQALDRPPNEQQQFLTRACVDLPSEIRAEVLSLLQADGELNARSAAFLDSDAPDDHSIHDPLLGTTVGPYRIQKRLGGGGFGVVYLAQRTDEFQQSVALKVIHSHHELNQAILKRFELERQLLSDLSHPNVARLLDGGSTEEGRPYFVMEYVDGMPITQFCNSRTSSIEQKLSLFQQVCRAVAHAHQYSIIHRDLKPANILVDTQGVPKLVDFGIAKLLDQRFAGQHELVTQTGQLVMTPEYASPEQANGQPVGMASDVYSLGVVLYELLTGQRPYEVPTRSPIEAAQIISQAIPRKPSQVANSAADSLVGATSTTTPKPRTDSKILRGDLDNIALKALRKEPAERYQSAQAFADDIQCYFTGQPVAARKPSTRYFISKFVRRHRLPVAISMIAATLLLIAGAGVLLSWQRSTELANRLAVSLTHADQLTANLAHSLYRADINLAFKRLEEGNPPSVGNVIRRYLPAEDQDDLRDSSWYLLAHQAIPDSSLKRHAIRLKSTTNRVVAFDNKSQLIFFVADDQQWSTGTWYGADVDTGTMTELCKSNCNTTAASSNGMTVAMHQSRRPNLPTDSRPQVPSEEIPPIEIKSLENRPVANSIPCDIVIENLFLSDDGARLAGYSYEGTLRVWNATSGDLILSGQQLGRMPLSGYLPLGAFSPDNRHFAFLEPDSADDQWLLTIWNLTTFSSRAFTTRNNPTQIKFSPDGRQLVIAGEVLEFVDLTAEILTSEVLAPEEIKLCQAIGMSASGRLLAVTTYDFAVSIWDLESRSLVARRYFDYWIPEVYFRPSEDQVVGSHFESVWSWNFLEDTADVKTVFGYRPNWIDTFDVHEPGGTVAFAGGDNQLVVWDSTSDRVQRFGPQDHSVFCTAISRDGHLAASGAASGNVEVWDLMTGQQVRQFQHAQSDLKDGERACISLSFSPDCHTIVSGNMNFMRGWNVSTGELLWHVPTHHEWVMDSKFDQAGRLFVAGSQYERPGFVRIWDVSSRPPTVLHELPHSAVVTTLAISPDNSLLATADLREVRLYDLTTSPPKRIPMLARQSKWIPSLSFSPDNKILFSASSRGVTMWDVETAQEMHQLVRDQNVHAVRMFVADDDRLGLVIGVKHPNSERGDQMRMRWIDPKAIEGFWRDRQRQESLLDDE